MTIIVPSVSFGTRAVPGMTKKSGMISLDVAPGTIPVSPGGIPDHHITVVFVGDLGDEDFDEVSARAAQAASEMPGPLHGIIQGQGQFPPSESSDWKTPVFAQPVVEGIHDLRAKLEDLNASQHKEFHPHMTQAYLDPGEKPPDPVTPTPVTFTHLSVHRGDQVRRFPFGVVPPVATIRRSPIVPGVSRVAGPDSGTRDWYEFDLERGAEGHVGRDADAAEDKAEAGHAWGKGWGAAAKAYWEQHGHAGQRLSGWKAWNAAHPYSPKGMHDDTPGAKEANAERSAKTQVERGKISENHRGAYLAGHEFGHEVGTKLAGSSDTPPLDSKQVDDKAAPLYVSANLARDRKDHEEHAHLLGAAHGFKQAAKEKSDWEKAHDISPHKDTPGGRGTKVSASVSTPHKFDEGHESADIGKSPLAKDVEGLTAHRERTAAEAKQDLAGDRAIALTEIHEQGLGASRELERLDMRTMRKPPPREKGTHRGGEWDWFHQLHSDEQWRIKQNGWMQDAVGSEREHLGPAELAAHFEREHPGSTTEEAMEHWVELTRRVDAARALEPSKMKGGAERTATLPLRSHSSRFGDFNWDSLAPNSGHDVAKLFSAQADAEKYLGEHHANQAHELVARELGASHGPALHNMRFEDYSAEVKGLRSTLASAAPADPHDEWGIESPEVEKARARLNELLPEALVPDEHFANPDLAQVHQEARAIAKLAGVNTEYHEGYVPNSGTTAGVAESHGPGLAPAGSHGAGAPAEGATSGSGVVASASSGAGGGGVAEKALPSNVAPEHAAQFQAGYAEGRAKATSFTEKTPLQLSRAAAPHYGNAKKAREAANPDHAAAARHLGVALGFKDVSREKAQAEPLAPKVEASVTQGPTLRVKDFEGRVGDKNHVTRIEEGHIPTSAIAHLQGASGERPGEHRNKQGADWTGFVNDIKANGIQHPIFITVDHNREPQISEGNHRRDAAVALGHETVPVEIKYFGHAEREGTVAERGENRQKNLGALKRIEASASSKPNPADYTEKTDLKAAVEDEKFIEQSQKGAVVPSVSGGREPPYRPIPGAPQKGEWDWTGVTNRGEINQQGDPKWRQAHGALMEDALHHWAGDPVTFEAHILAERAHEPQPGSGSGKHMRAWGAALDWELKHKSRTNPVPLYRGSHLAPKGINSWSELRRVANHWASKNGGTVHVAPAGTVKGLKSSDYIGEGLGEREWVVDSDAPLS